MSLVYLCKYGGSDEKRTLPNIVSLIINGLQTFQHSLFLRITTLLTWLKSTLLQMALFVIRNKRQLLHRITIMRSPSIYNTVTENVVFIRLAIVLSYQTFILTRLQSNSVITNITGPSIFVCYSREFIITVNIYVAKWSIGAKNGNIFYSL